MKLCSLTYLDISSSSSNSGYIWGDTIPAPILTLSSLIYLNASKCNFTHVTDEIGNMKCLQYLNLEKNSLNRISERIAELPLEVLKLSHNKLIDMPHQMIDMKTLIYLDLSYNKFSNLTFIYSLKSLRTLILTKTKMTFISSDISNLIELQCLKIDRNSITTLPVEICSLISLVELEIQDNNIENLPNEIGNLKNLKSFKVLDNNLSELPLSFVYLKNLKFYQLDNRIIDEMEIDIYAYLYKNWDGRVWHSKFDIYSDVIQILFKEIIKYHQIHAAIIIQKHIRGNLIRNKFGVHNPNCSNGKHFILRMFIITTDFKE
jgi:Leucine-rich repeat (LRR) protein